jgi:nitrate reductase assembly molybdenum cofactor insertion protein NarJ
MTRVNADRIRIAAAAEWRLIGLLLERPRSGWSREVAALRLELHDRRLRRVAAAAGAATEGEYLRLLGPGGPVSPREVTYQAFADPGQLLGQLATIYAAFGFRPQVEEPIDHIAVEVAFIGYLLLKEAFAAARGDRAAAETTASTRRHFMDAHLAALAGGVAQRLDGAEGSYLRAVARLLVGRLPVRPSARARASVDPVDVCGGCEFGAVE